MKVKRMLTIAGALAAACTMIFAQGGRQAAPRGEKRLVDISARQTYSIPYGDSTAVCLVRDVVIYHGGAVLTCDSAVRYNDRRMECFGNVLINKNQTYIYGDRADFNAETHMARVYAPLVKVVDGDATLYTYDFSFNTQTNVGEYARGGVVTNNENLLESERGYYYADTREVVCVDRVEMRNADYDLKGDSVVYNLSTDHAYYFDRTNIWNTKGDYLYADRGEYEKAGELYRITRSGYVLTPSQELWSDSLDYFRAAGHAVLRGNIQVDDSERKTLAFADYGEYWKEPGNLFLTRRPSLISYDPQQGEDSLYMSSDSMFLYTIRVSPEALSDAAGSFEAEMSGDPSAAHVPDSVRHARPRRDSLAGERAVRDSLAGIPASGRADGVPAVAAASAAVPRPDSLPAAVDSSRMSADSVAREPVDTLTRAQQRELLREAARRDREALKARKDSLRRIELDSIAARRLARTRAKLDAQRARDSIRRAEQTARLREKLAERLARGKRIDREDSLLLGLVVDSTRLQAADSTALKPAVPPRDSVAADSLRGDSLPEPAAADTLYRLVRGYRNVKIFRTDFQAVCDSLVSDSRDSIIHLYIDPVMWNEMNQITSDVVDVYTERQRIVRAEFEGRPMMVARLDTMHYNQVKGKTMTAFFRNNEIYRHDVKGNAQTLYYFQEDGSPEVVGLLVLESGDMTFYIEQKRIVEIAYRNNVVFDGYPMDKIPATQELYLEDFRWEESRRPTRGEIFDRELRPSRRQRVTHLPRPDFPIARRIDAYRRRLVESGRWSDRNERVSAAAVEFIRSRGYLFGEEPEPLYRPEPEGVGAADTTESANLSAAPDVAAPESLPAARTASSAAGDAERSAAEPPAAEAGSAPSGVSASGVRSAKRDSLGA